MANQKGGVAKTTSSLSLAAALHEKGQRVLVVDLDPQSNLSMSQGIDVENLQDGMYDVLVKALPISDMIQVREIDVAPAGIELAGAELALSAMIGRERALQRALGRQTLRYEASMIFLATIVAGAPFMGLLGTVWGVMDAFSAVSVQQTTTIQTLAPGVSAALLTTIAGLVVAIPSVFGYNFIFSRVKMLVTEIENYASSLADRLELESL
jgi:biopolymer transport protein TolQ